jgi:hypothetical protein
MDDDIEDDEELMDDEALMDDGIEEDEELSNADKEELPADETIDVVRVEEVTYEKQGSQQMNCMLI